MKNKEDNGWDRKGHGNTVSESIIQVSNHRNI